MKKEIQKTKAVGHLRFTLEGDDMAVGPWNLALSQSSDTPLQYARLSAWLRLMADALDKGVIPPNLPSVSTSSLGLQYDKFHLEGDPLRVAPKPMTKERFAEILDEAAREVLQPDCTTDLVALNLITSLGDHLFGSAMRSNQNAQKALMWAAQNIVDRFASAAWMKAPGIIEEAVTLPWIPGKVSLGPEIGETMKEMCRRVKQGEKFAGPPQKEKAKGKKATLSTAQHHLVERLFRYMDSYRHNAAASRGTAWEARIEKLHPLVRRMVRLRPFGDDSVKEWITVAKEVVLDATGGEPLRHVAFRSGGEFESLGNLDRRGEPALWKNLREAWQYRAGRTAGSSVSK